MPLLVPKWKSAMFWPLLVSSISGNLNKFVAEFIEDEKFSFQQRKIYF
jgi:hypothetical protein